MLFFCKTVTHQLFQKMIITIYLYFIFVSGTPFPMQTTIFTQAKTCFLKMVDKLMFTYLLHMKFVICDWC